jgi:hypothetical protein
MFQAAGGHGAQPVFTEDNVAAVQHLVLHALGVLLIRWPYDPDACRDSP